MNKMIQQQEFFISGGGADSKPRKCHKINLGDIGEVKDLETRVSNLFNFPKSCHGIGFYRDEVALRDMSTIMECPTPVEVRFQHVRIREPPGPNPLPYVGNYYELYPDPLGNYDRLFALYGPVIKIVNMGTTIYLTNDPDVSRVVMQEGSRFTKTTSDPSHPLYYMRNQECLFTCDSSSPNFAVSHKFLPPSMTPKALRHYAPTIYASIAKSIRVFDELDDRELAFNVYQYMFKMAGEIIWKVILGMDLGHFESVDAPPHETLRWLGEYLSLLKKASLRPAWWAKLPFGEPAKLKVVRDLLWNGVAKGIDKAEKGTGDLPLQDAALHATCIADYMLRATDEKGEKLPKNIMLSNCVIMVGAGFVTTSSLLSWLIYALVKYPGNQERLLQELIDHGADKHWTYDELHNMRFLDHFVKETQRMHNPSFQTARNAVDDVVLPGGYFLPKGAVIIPTFPSIHKNSLHWDNPNRFDPDRWDQMGRNVKAYTPFAAGTRGCIGFNLALLEVKMFMAMLVYRYQFVDVPGDAVVYDPEFIVIRPLNFYVRAVRRTTWPERSQSEPL